MSTNFLATLTPTTSLLVLSLISRGCLNEAIVALVPVGDSRCPLLGRDGFFRRKGDSFLSGKLAPLVVSRLAPAAPSLEPPIHPPHP